MNRPEVKGLVLPLVWILVLLLRKLTVIQIPRVKSSLLGRKQRREVELVNVDNGEKTVKLEMFTKV